MALSLQRLGRRDNKFAPKTNVTYNISIRLVEFSFVVRVLPSKAAETCRTLKLSDVVLKSLGSIAVMPHEVARSKPPIIS